MTPEQIKAALAEAIREHRNAGRSSDEIAAAVMALVGPKPLVWVQSGGSHIMDNESHTVPTRYTVRYADENGWKWSCAGQGAFGWEFSPKLAQAAAQSHADAAHWGNTALADMIGGE